MARKRAALYLPSRPMIPVCATWCACLLTWAPALCAGRRTARALPPPLGLELYLSALHRLPTVGRHRPLAPRLRRHCLPCAALANPDPTAFDVASSVLQSARQTAVQPR